MTQPWLAYLHITPGVLYLLLGILQLTYRFRSRHYLTHRRLGRLLPNCGFDLSELSRNRYAITSA